jgi:hypothetical protein
MNIPLLTGRDVRQSDSNMAPYVAHQPIVREAILAE